MRTRLSVLVPLAGVAAGIGWGAVSAGDISRARAQGSFSAAVWTPPAAEAAPLPQRDDPVAEAHGYAMASSRNIRTIEQCTRIAPEFRRGCISYIEENPAEEQRVGSASSLAWLNTDSTTDPL